MLHDAGDDDISSVAQGVHVDFNCILQEVIHQHRALLRVLHGFSHIPAYCIRVVGDDHRTAAQHVRRPYQHRVADAFCAFQGLLDGGHHGARRLGNFQVLQQLAEALAILRQIDAFRRRAQDFYAGSLQREGEVQRSLASELHNHPNLRARGGLVLINSQHVFQGQGLEVQAVAGVVIGRHRFRIAIHHDGFVVVFAQRERSMTATVVELNSLPDAVGAAPQNNDLSPRRRRRFILLIVGGI